MRAGWTTAKLVALALALVLALGTTAPAQKKEDTVLGKTSAEWLTILREHKELRFRRAALIALETFGPLVKGVVPGVVEAVEKDSDPKIRREAALLLGRMGNDAKSAPPALAQALRHDKSEAVREAAAAALSSFGEEASDHVPALAAALKDKQAGVRAAAAESLYKLGSGARSALPMLLTTARTRTEERYPRQFAVQYLGRWGKDEPETCPALAEILADKSAPQAVRAAAAEAIAKAGCASKECVTALAGVLGEAKQPELRRAAAVAVAGLGGKAKDAWPAVKAGLRDGDSALRNQLVRAAGALAKEQIEAVGELTRLAKTDDATENRLAAVQELGELGPFARNAVEDLQAIAQRDVRGSVREAAAVALKKIKGE